MQSNAGFEVTVITGLSSYLSRQVCWLERQSSTVFADVSPDFEKIRSQGTVVAGVPSRFCFQQ